MQVMIERISTPVDFRSIYKVHRFLDEESERPIDKWSRSIPKTEMALVV